MPIFSFINELTVNGKPVEEDEEEKDDDYTTGEDENTDDPAPEDGGEDNTLDLDPNSDAGNDDTTDDDEDNLDDDYTIQGDDTEETPDTTDEPAPDDGGDAGLDLNPNSDEGDTTDAPTDGDTTEEPPVDDGGENPPADDTGEDQPTDGANADGDLDMGGEDDDDYTADGGDGGSDENPPEDGVDTGTDDTTSETPENDIESKIKQTEAEIFNSLSDDEKAIKNKELVDDFIIAKQTVKVFLEKIRTITITDENRAILIFVETNLLELNNIITDYIIKRYSKKTYVENFVLYQQILLTITQLKDIISKIKVEEKDEK